MQFRILPEEVGHQCTFCLYSEYREFGQSYFCVSPIEGSMRLLMQPNHITCEMVQEWHFFRPVRACSLDARQ